MLSKILSYVIGFTMLLLIIVIALQYYISKPIETKELICYKNRLLHKIDDGENVYIRIKGISCEFEKGMIIIKEQS